MDQEPSPRADHRNLARLAKALVETCVRNTVLEDLHAGIFQGSEAGDYSDVKVVPPMEKSLGADSRGFRMKR
jgi:hypothetical protein